VSLQENAENLILDENHRRVVSAVLRRVEATCDEVLDWLVRPNGNLQRISEDVSAWQADELRALVDGLRHEVHRVQNELTIGPSIRSRSRGIAASVSLTRVELQEVLTPGLRGYGALPPELEAALDAKFARLLTFLEAMSRIAENGNLRSAP
jgi:hypothetical protein